MAKDNDYLKMI
jgi:hypothetical protein